MAKKIMKNENDSNEEIIDSIVSEILMKMKIINSNEKKYVKGKYNE